MIVVENKKKSVENILLDYPDATVIDVTSYADGGWVKFSPFYPHGGIPVPFSDGYYSETVEGIWQGLKVFEHEGVSQKTMRIMGMTGIKRSGKKLGACLGHQKGMESAELLGYVDARKLIYVPAYEWVLANRCQNLLEKLRIYSQRGVVVLLDYDTNSDIEDPKKPLSHASLIVRYIVSRLTDAEREEWKEQAEENKKLSKQRKAAYKKEQKKAVEMAAAKAVREQEEHDKAMVKGNPSGYTPLWLRDQLQAGAKLRFLSFLRPNAPLGKIDRACLSPWYGCRFEIDGIKYNSLEQYLKSEKARLFEDEDIRQRIMSTSDTETIKNLGREVRNFDEEKWTKVKFGLAVKGNLAKFGQNLSLKEYLLSTEERILVETHPYDKVWGVGLPEGHPAIRQPEIWPGSNLMGFALMVVRDSIKASLEENA